jgi:hypothetical protein
MDDKKKGSNAINTLLTNEELKDAIVAFIAERQGVSCVELGREFGEGNHILELKHNLITVFGVSGEVAMALVELISVSEIVAIPSEVLVYVIDGVVPGWPIAKSAREYKNPHWLPVTFDTYEFGINELTRLVKNKKLLKPLLEDLSARRI